ncbi:hypothetical protein N7G274_006421 [Stereocaulon virgatum]|uniref:GTP-binding protein 8 n=1 Tax=Stereocaulon virgatum TaxID=373712 RepID=A0ABR4A5L3_9LECA
MSVSTVCRGEIRVQLLLRKTTIRHASTIPIAETSAGPTSLSYYWDTAAPTPIQLKRAERFFRIAPPKLLYSAGKFRTVKFDKIPEVAFLGRSNVGKSSLLNALLGQNICRVSSKPGRTQSMNFFAAGGEDSFGSPGKLAVLDMPGYGKGSREEWGPEIMKYLTGRRQFKRAFLLVDALHGLKSSDEELLSLFRQNSISHQIILSKVDRILFPEGRPSAALVERHSPDLQRICDELKTKIQPGKRDGPEALGEIVTCSSETVFKGKKLGVNNVRWAILAATGLGDQKVKRLSASLLNQSFERTTDRSHDAEHLQKA